MDDILAPRCRRAFVMRRAPISPPEKKGGRRAERRGASVESGGIDFKQ
ncbi:hypothetical protein [Burkholderia humptydooensis]|nr:hypothetical protein [Burkholderia humptydooensis]